MKKKKRRRIKPNRNQLGLLINHDYSNKWGGGVGAGAGVGVYLFLKYAVLGLILTLKQHSFKKR